MFTSVLTFLYASAMALSMSKKLP